MHTYTQNSWQIIKTGLPLPRQMCIMQLLPSAKANYPTQKFWPTEAFFKIQSSQQNIIQKLCVDYPNLPCYLIAKTLVKVPAGWLIDQQGLKGQGVPPILTHAKQALVLTNHMPFIATQEGYQSHS